MHDLENVYFQQKSERKIIPNEKKIMKEVTLSNALHLESALKYLSSLNICEQGITHSAMYPTTSFTRMVSARKDLKNITFYG